MDWSLRIEICIFCSVVSFCSVENTKMTSIRGSPWQLSMLFDTYRARNSDSHRQCLHWTVVFRALLYFIASRQVGRQTEANLRNPVQSPSRVPALIKASCRSSNVACLETLMMTNKSAISSPYLQDGIRKLVVILQHSLSCHFQSFPYYGATLCFCSFPEFLLVVWSVNKSSP